MSRGKSGGKEKEKEMMDLNAVIMADSFTEDFKPVTLEGPRTMMPVAGIVLLDYTIEFLISNGIEQIYVMSCAHSDIISKHITEGRWGQQHDVKVSILVSKSSTCLAEALRELSGYDVVRRDFVLITGDIIANVSNLKQIWRKHMNKREADPSILMTLLLNEDSAPMYRGRDNLVKESIIKAATQKMATAHSDEDLVVNPEEQQVAEQDDTFGILREERVTVILDPLTNNMLQYHAWVETNTKAAHDSSDDESSFGSGSESSGRKDKVRVGLDMELFSKYPTLNMRSDLVETGMAICTVGLMLLFEQNPDFRDMRDCIRSVINEELLGNKIMAEILPPNSFVKRVRTVENYISVCQAVVDGWTYPLVVDAPFANEYHCVASREPSVYIDVTATLSHSSTTGRSTLIGPGVSVSDNSCVTNSCLNKDTTVGKNVTIKHSQIWSKVTIGDNCTIDSAVVCSGAVIGDGCTIGKYAIVSYGVKLAAGTVVKPFSRITRVKATEESDDDDWDEVAEIEIMSSGGDPGVVGETGVGRLWVSELTEANLDRHKLSIPQDPDASSTDTIFASSVDGCSSRSSDGSEPATHDEKFAREVISTVKRAVSGNLEFDGVLLEVNSVKFGYDASIVDCCRACLLAFLQIAEVAEDPLNCFYKHLLKKWKKLLLKFHSLPVEKEILSTLIEFAKHSPEIEEKIRLFIHSLYDKDVLSEETILAWESAKLAERAARSISEFDKKILEDCAELFEMLKCSSDEETDSD
eukprot:TRINITY_DN5826_c1_g1_i1.p1 TRINITY_DN5826_c1_g1~~TRINITY_DN5826_c1_g1_i1.p1  ORF type:complete len:753 (+),score=208.41 TRINITY_DN5826_c1_g1_i1:37-2295(+)